MNSENGPCHCPCFCEPAAPRIFEQTAARYNDRSSFANNNQQDTQTMLLAQFQAQANNTLSGQPMNDLAAAILQLIPLMGQGTTTGP